MKKILMLSYRFPYPVTEGSIIRIYNIGRILSRRYEVDLLVVSDRAGARGDEHLRELERIFSRVFLFVFSPRRFAQNALKGIFSGDPLQAHYHYFGNVQKWIDRHKTEYDLLWCVHIRMAKYVENNCMRRVIDFVDATSINYQENQEWASGAWRYVLAVENRRLLSYEIEQLKHFERAFISSGFDKAYLDARSADAGDRLIVIPNGVGEELLSRPKRCAMEEEWLVFLGRMKYAPNVDAVVYFAEEVFPILKREVPALRFMIVGVSPAGKVLKLRRVEGIEVTGFVEDPWEYMEKAKVVVAPLRFGAGIQYKILEAMALGKAVVTTAIGARGIEGEAGKHFIVAQSSAEMACQILALLRNEALRESIGVNARALVEERYRWDMVGEKLLAEVEGVFV